MARPRKVVEVPPGEAVFIVEALILDGRIEPSMLAEYRARYLEEIRTLESRIAHLRSLGGPVIPVAVGVAVAAAAPAVARAIRRAGPKAVAKVRKAAARVSPERMKSRELQGRYLGLMRQIPKDVVKKRFGKDAIGKKGKESVIAEMQQYIAKK